MGNQKMSSKITSKKNKKKNKDFQKVKLKVGRKLQKSINETTPQVQVGRIQLKTQFKPTGTEQPTNKKRRLDLTELLGQCSNCCASTRHEALVSLRELFTNSPEVLALTLTTIIRTVSTLFVDRDSVVRGDARKLLRHVLSSLDVDVAAVLDTQSHPLLILGLCRAMTHIQEDIQLDSLYILDIYLDHCPMLVSSGSGKLLEDFLPLISRQQQTGTTYKLGGGGSASSSQANTSRSLLVNPNAKLASQKYRAKVLERLVRVLAILTDQMTKNKDIGRTCNDGNEQIYSLWNARSGVSEMSSVLGNRDKLQTCVMTLVPLLIDCWIETGLTSSMTANECANIDDVSLLIVRNVLAVLHPLLSIVVNSVDDSPAQIRWLNSLYSKKFVQHFVTKFPYRIRVRQAKKAKQKRIGSLSSSVHDVCTSVNLSVCGVMAHFIDEAGQPLSSSNCGWIEQVANYIIDRLQEEETQRLNNEQLQLIFKLTSFLVHMRLPNGIHDRLLQTCNQVARNLAPLTPRAKEWFNFFSDLCLRSFHVPSSISSCTGVQEWISSLPRLLLLVCTAGHMDTADVLASVSLAGRQQHQAFLQEFGSHLDKYLDVAFLGGMSVELQIRFAQTFIWQTGLETRHFQRIAALVLCDTLTPAAFKCICESLAYRLPAMSSEIQTSFKTTNFLNMLLSVTLGSTRADVEDLDREFRSLFHLSLQLTTLVIDSNREMVTLNKNWSRQKHLIPFMFSILWRLPDFESVCRTVVDFVKKFLVKQRVLSLLSACSLIYAIKHLDEMVSAHHRQETMVISAHDTCRKQQQDNVCTSAGNSSYIVQELLTQIIDLLKGLSRSMFGLSPVSSMSEGHANSYEDKILQIKMIEEARGLVLQIIIDLLRHRATIYDVYIEDVDRIITGMPLNCDANVCIAILHTLQHDDDLKETSRENSKRIRKLLDVVNQHIDKH